MKGKPVPDVFRKRVGRYYVGRTIGEGTYAKVKYGQHMESGEAVAIKVLDKAELVRTNMVAQIKREIHILKNLRHPNVVDLKEVLASRDKVYMVLELMAGGELFDKVVAEGPFGEDGGRKVLQQLLDGLEYVHQQGIYHRDLKPENVLLTAEGDVKLSDFGLGALPAQGRENGLLKTTCGTPNYVAPEVLSRDGYEGGPADIWSLGVCLYVIMAGSLPFDEPNLPSLFRKISRADYCTPIWFSPGLIEVLRLMLQPDPTKRATIPQLRQHPWVSRDYRPPRLDRISGTSEDAEHPGDIFGATVKLHRLTLEEQRDSMKQIPRMTSSGAVNGSALKQLNAFEMINAALDISGLFERRDDVVRRHTRFTSKQPKAEVLAGLEAAAAAMGGSAKRRSQHRAKLTVPGSRGPVSLSVEVFDVVPGTCLAECIKAKGDTLDFYTAYAALTEQVSGLIAANHMGNVDLDHVAALAPLPGTSRGGSLDVGPGNTSTAAPAESRDGTPGAGPSSPGAPAEGHQAAEPAHDRRGPEVRLAGGRGLDAPASWQAGPGQSGMQVGESPRSAAASPRDATAAAIEAALRSYSSPGSRSESESPSPRGPDSSTGPSPQFSPIGSPVKGARGWLQGMRGKLK